MAAEAPDPGIDLERPNFARMYDYFLGGGHNFAVDREQAERLLAAYPDSARAARANRAFLGRVVRWCLDQGVDQFLDLGSGVPTVGNVHEIAQPRRPSARVAYVDFEPVAVAHAEEILAGNDLATVTRADMRDPDAVLGAPGVAGLLDFTRPVAVLALAVLHAVSGDLGRLLAVYRARLAPGSVLIVSHTSDDHDDPGVAAQGRAVREGVRGSATEMTLRSRAELLALFDGLDLIHPGLVDVTDWPERSAEDPTVLYAAVGRVPPTS